MKMTIEGVDFLPYIAHGGIKWQLSDIDGPNAGRLSDGSLQRDRVATKIRFDLTMRPLDSWEMSTVLSAVRKEYYFVEYENPITGRTEHGTFYSNNYSMNTYGMTVSGKTIYTGLVIPVIQK